MKIDQQAIMLKVESVKVENHIHKFGVSVVSYHSRHKNIEIKKTNLPEIYLTGNHLVETENGSKAASDILPGDIIISRLNLLMKG
jgi:hypothetical protein